MKLTAKSKLFDAMAKHVSSEVLNVVSNKWNHRVWRTNRDTEMSLSSQDADMLVQKTELIVKQRHTVPLDAD